MIAGLYVLAAHLLNESTIELDDRDLLVRHAPVPWWRNRTVPIRDIVSVSWDERIRRNRGHVVHITRVVAELQSGRQAVLLDGLSAGRGEAVWIAHVLDGEIGARQAAPLRVR